MRSLKTIRVVAALALSCACIAGLAACSSAGGSGKVAATVNGSNIMEDDITSYIVDFRTSNGLESDDAWSAWMLASGMTPETVRNQVIEYYENIEIVKQAAKEKNVTVSASDVDAQVQTMKANYDSDEAWTNALASAGTTEEKYRESVENAMLQSKLQSVLAEEESKDASDDELIEAMGTYLSSFDGARKSSHILFASDDEGTAQQVLDDINSGEIDFADAAKEYSTDTGSAVNGGDVGWDKLNSFVTEYQSALSELDEGQVSGLVTSDYGIHIIKCTEVFNAPDEVASIDQIPSEFVDYVREVLESGLSNQAYTDYVTKFKDEAEIVVNDMPEGLSYDVEVEAVTSDGESTEAASDDVAEDSAGASEGEEEEKEAE